MYCSNCGRKLNETEHFCPNCGSEQGQPAYREPSAPLRRKENSIYGLLSKYFGIFSIFYLDLAIASVILGIIGMNRYQEEQNLKNCKTGIIFSIIWFATSLVISVVLVFLLYGMMLLPWLLSY